MTDKPDANPQADDAAPEDLATEALDNLVNQFARPLDFLREFVQNSIDAGSPRVAIWLRFVPDDEDPAEGVLEVHIDDWGEGMDEDIIDTHLTRLFSSTKEDDLTKIGKFGIGFTSIFAIRPEAVLLHTGRHGESWELLFHADRSFDKVRSEQPITGTRITLYKRMPAEESETFAKDCRWILGWWCEHSDTPITFEDRSGTQQGDEVEAADPFAAFGDPEALNAGPEVVTRPLGLDGGGLELRREGRIEAVVGYRPRPRYAFYNGGLTLVNTTNVDVLGVREARLRHLTFKVKSDHLEHTLTRDNVLQDTHWVEAMDVVTEASEALCEALLEETERRVEAGEDLAEVHTLLAAEARIPDPEDRIRGWSERRLFRDHRGRPVTLEALEAQEDEQGTVLMAGGSAELIAALEADEVLLLEDLPETRDLLRATWIPPMFAGRDDGRRLHRADELYLLPELVSTAEMAPWETDLEGAGALLEEATGGRVTLRLGDFGGAQRARGRPLALEGPEDGRVFRRPEASLFRVPGFLRSRSLLVNRHHPYLELQRVVLAEDPDVAAFALAQALLHLDGEERESSYQRLGEAAISKLQPPEVRP